MVAFGKVVGHFGVVHPEVRQMGWDKGVLSGVGVNPLWRGASCGPQQLLGTRKLPTGSCTTRTTTAFNPTAVLCVQVLEKFEILYPVSALEINVEPFCHDQMYRSLLVPVACVSTPL